MSSQVEAPSAPRGEVQRQSEAALSSQTPKRSEGAKQVIRKVRQGMRAMREKTANALDVFKAIAKGNAGAVPAPEKIAAEVTFPEAKGESPTELPQEAKSEVPPTENSASTQPSPEDPRTQEQRDREQVQQWKAKILEAYNNGTDPDIKQMVDDLAKGLPGGGEQLTENRISAATRLAEILAPESPTPQRDLALTEVTGSAIADELARVSRDMQSGDITNPQRFSEAIGSGVTINSVSLGQLEKTLQELSARQGQTPQLMEKYKVAVSAIEAIKKQLDYTAARDVRNIAATLLGQ